MALGDAFGLFFGLDCAESFRLVGRWPGEMTKLLEEQRAAGQSLWGWCSFRSGVLNERPTLNDQELTPLAELQFRVCILRFPIDSYQ